MKYLSLTCAVAASGLWLSGCTSRGGGDAGALDLRAPAADLAGAEADLAIAEPDLGGADQGPTPPDLAAPLDLSRSADLAAPPDLAPPVPSEADCYWGWRSLTGCPAPQITDSYLTQNCSGTTGVFVVGRYFQHGNQYDATNAWMPHGPYAVTSRLNRDTWNWITPRAVCITTSNDATYWTGFDMQLKNPDGQLSNKVTVLNKLAGRPALPSSGSSDAFDTSACLDAGMTMAQAVARFPAGATMVSLGNVTIRRRSRVCNTLTGCPAWGAATTEATVEARLQTSGTVHFALDGRDCGSLGASDYTLTYNSCAAAGAAGSYSVHVAASCLMLWHTTRSAVAGDNTYTQTDYGGVLRY